MQTAIAIDRQAIEAFCLRHHITWLALFGSVLRDDFRADSDVDVLVTFAPGHTPGFFRLHKMQEELSGLLDERKVDLVTPKFLNHLIHDEVLASAEVLYAA